MEKGRGEVCHAGLPHPDMEPVQPAEEPEYPGRDAAHGEHPGLDGGQVQDPASEGVPPGLRERPDGSDACPSR